MDLNFLRPLYEAPGPIASVHLDTTRDTEDAEKKIELRWRALRERLAGDGADEATLDALEERAGGVRGVPGPQGEALFAARGRVLAVHTMARPPARDHATWLPVPDPLDLVVDRDHQLPCVVVAIDREGADVDAYEAAGHDPVSERSFNGTTLHIQKVNAGGFAESRYHRHAENVWNDNAEHAAREVENAVADVGAAVVFVGGDERAIGLLRSHLAKLDPPVVEIPGGRADASARLREALDQALDDAMVAAHDAVLADLRARVPQGTAVEGADATLRTLSEGRVETLLLGADRETDGWLWASPDVPLLLGTRPTVFDRPDTAFTAPGSALMLRSAVLGDAAFTELLDHGATTAGTAATLRFTL